MAVFNYLGEMSGGKKPKIIEAEYKENKDVKKGTPIYTVIAVNKVTASPGGRFIGIAAKDYCAERDEFALNPASGSKKLSVNVSEDSFYRVNDGAVLTCSVPFGAYCTFEGLVSEGNVNCTSGGFLILKERCEGSTNPHEPGHTVRILYIKHKDGVPQFWTEQPLDCVSGDKYHYLPGFGFENLHLDANGELSVDFLNKSNLYILGSDVEKRTLTVKFKQTL